MKKYQSIVIQILFLFCLSFCFLITNSNAQIVHDERDSCQISPEFKFTTLTGQQVTSTDLKGKIIVLDYWDTRCGPCRKSMPQIEKFYQQYKNDQRVVLYLVNAGWEKIEKAKDFADSKRSSFLFFSWGGKYDLPFAYDDSSVTMKTFKFDATPSTIIIDTNFRIRYKHHGYIEGFDDFLVKHVEQYLSEK